MAECGKGCMPECEYFTTGGCISPFNCQYKIETGYINSATSIPTYMEKQMSMTAEEIEHCLERFTMGKTTDVMNFDYAGTLAYIQRLKAENAALRERLDKAVELPFLIGDMAYYCDHIDYKGYVIIERKIVGIKQIKNEPKWWDRRESFMVAIVQGKKQCNDEIGEWCYDIDAFGTEWWTDRAAAEKRLAEWGGEK